MRRVIDSPEERLPSQSPAGRLGDGALPLPPLSPGSQCFLPGELLLRTEGDGESQTVQLMNVNVAASED